MSNNFYDLFDLRDPTQNKSLEITKYKTTFEAFCDKFKRSGRPSVDLFLSTNSEFMEIGKLSILHSILHYEKGSKFHEDMEEDRSKQDWFTYLYNRMTEKLTQKESHSRFKENNVSFITFNYDRCLEHMLFDNFTNTFPREDLKEYLSGSERDIIKLLPFPIVHVHGVIAPLQRGGAFCYQSDRISKDDIELARNFKIIYEKYATVNPDAVELIHKANRIFFLGFGYADENLQVLGIPDSFGHEQKIYGTACGKTNKEIASIEAKLKKPPYNYSEFKILDTDCYSLLREFL